MPVLARRPTVIVTADFLREFPEVYIQLRASRREVTPGRHFGSRFIRG